MYRDAVGVIGGFGAYATLNFYEMILSEFATGRERDNPNIIIDNDFTMPSRTRALLYGEDYDAIVDMISRSMKNLLQLGSDHIILVCGTAHYFLKDVYKKVPEAEKRVLNLIELVKRHIKENGIDKVLVIAAEGTLKKRVYESILNDVICISPESEYYSRIRGFIESVKTNRFTDEVINDWFSFLAEFGSRDVILGCTELPVLVNECENRIPPEHIVNYIYIDPMKLAISELKKILK